jgi:hypothetical protein
MERVGQLSQDLSLFYRGLLGGKESEWHTRTEPFPYDTCHNTELGTQTCQTLRNMVGDMLKYEDAKQVQNHVRNEGKFFISGTFTSKTPKH